MQNINNVFIINLDKRTDLWKKLRKVRSYFIKNNIIVKKITGNDFRETIKNDNLILNDNEEPFEYLWNTVLDGEGQYEIKAVIHNLDGNYISDSINVEVVITNLFIPQDFSDLSNEEIFEYLDSGDTISVSSGTYNCNYLNFTNYPNLNFIGLDGAENVILDGGGQGRVLAVSESLVQGFTIQNGLATDNGGGGILLYGSILRNCIVRNNVCSWSAYSRGGGGIEAIYTCIIDNRSYIILISWPN